MMDLHSDNCSLIPAQEYTCVCRSFLVMWLAAIPFVFVASLQWLTIGFCIIVGYALLGFESFGVEIESPFGRDFNDLPVDKIASGIKANLMAALDFSKATDSIGAIHSKKAIDNLRSRRSSVYVDVWGVPEKPEPEKALWCFWLLPVAIIVSLRVLRKKKFFFNDILLHKLWWTPTIRSYSSIPLQLSFSREYKHRHNTSCGNVMKDRRLGRASDQADMHIRNIREKHSGWCLLPWLEQTS